MNGVNGCQQYAGESSEPDPKRSDGGHIGLERDAERADHVGVLNTGSDDAAERSPVEQQPQPRHAQDGDAEQNGAVI